VVASRSSNAATAVATRSDAFFGATAARGAALTPENVSVLDPERRSRLLAVKLATLAREHLGLEGSDPTTFPGGAALAVGGRAVVLVDDGPVRGLGPALAWAWQAGALSLDLLVEDAAGHLARRAACFAAPPAVWWVQGRALHPVEAESLPMSPAASAADLARTDELRDAGADVVVEHGVVAGEVLGLEMARVVDGRIEAGVGRHDREAFVLLHGEVPAPAALASVIAAVRDARRAGGPDHPLKRLAQERWLREAVLTRPELVGAHRLERHEGPHPRPSVKEPWPAVAAGDGVVVVCSVGIDLDLVPFAADARAAVDPEARLVLVVPERDAHPVTVALAAMLRAPAEIVTVPADWRSR
jgi:hypothetical protein